MTRRALPAALALAALLLAACADDGASGDPPVDACDHTLPYGQVHQAVAHGGPWQIPASTLSAGDSQYVDYTGAGTWQGASSCSGGMTPGADALRTWINDNYPQVSSIGGYSCRHINGNSSQTSVHATGRALDVHIPLHGGEADNDLGDPIGNYLIEHAEAIGIQFIIWDRWTWGAHRPAGDKSRSYGGAHPHHDHLHIELSVAGGAMQTPFFNGGVSPPEDGGGDTGSGDVCQDNGWYGDGVCDTNCANPDPDCDGGGDDGGSGDACADNGWYGDGFCDTVCANPDPDCEMEDDGTADQEDEGIDLCALLGWYGDGTCDILCPNPDPDCSGDGGGQDEGGAEGAGDICQERGWYGDGVCDGDCPMPDPDCDDGADANPDDPQDPPEDDGADYCAQQGWYGDGTCDDCPMPDPDCQGDDGGQDEGGQGAGGGQDDDVHVGGTEGDHGSGDICARRGLYGDGVCDRHCPNFDADCRDAAGDAKEPGGGADEPIIDDPMPEDGLPPENAALTSSCSTAAPSRTPAGPAGLLVVLGVIVAWRAPSRE